MADNVTADAGSGGATFRTDDDGTAHWPYTKIAFGPDNTQTIVASTATNPFPVALSDTDNAVLDTIDAVLDTINAKLVTGTIIGDVNANAGTNLNTSALLTSTNFSDVLGTATLVTTAQADALANTLDSVNVTAFSYVFNGSTWDRVREGSTAGSILVDLGSNNNVTIDSGTVTTVSTVTNLAQMGGVAISLNTGVRDTGTQRVTIATNDLVPVTGTITAVTSITNDVSIDDGGNSITVDSGAAFTVQEDGAALTALQLIDDPVFADDAAFTLASSKVMMQGAIRDDTLGALTAVEGDAVPLRVGSTGALHVTGAGGGTQYTVDDPGPTVVTMAGAVRDDALTTLTEVDGDATLLRVSSTGALHVTGGGGGTEYTEDVATANPIVGTATLMERVDALSTVTPVEADWIGLRGTAEGALWVQDFNSDAILVDTTSIDGKITACDTGAVVIASGTITTVSTVTNLAQMGGVAISLNTGVRDTGTQRVTIATNDLVPVTGTITAVTSITNDVNIADGGNSITVDSGAAFTVQEDGAALTALQLIDNAVSGAGFNVTQMNGVNLTMGSGVAGTGVQRVSVATDDVVTVDLAGNNDVQGDIAHDAVNSGNPFHLGAQAIAHGTNPTAVAAADRTRLYANRAGVPFMIGGHPNVVTKSARNTAAQTDTALVTVAGGLKIVVTRVSLTVDNSTTVDVDFEVGFGATTVPAAATGAGVAGMLADFMGVAAGGGITIGDGSGILGVGADGEDLRYSNTVPTTGNCTVTVSYYTIES